MTEAEYEGILARQAKWKNNGNRTPVQAANMELAPGYGPLATKAGTRPDIQGGERCSIHVHSIRKRLCDPDGISAKAAIDGLVHAGILVDDSCEFVSEVRFTQEQGKDEKTIITLTFEE